MHKVGKANRKLKSNICELRQTPPESLEWKEILIFGSISSVWIRKSKKWGIRALNSFNLLDVYDLWLYIEGFVYDTCKKCKYGRDKKTPYIPQKELRYRFTSLINCIQRSILIDYRIWNRSYYIWHMSMEKEPVDCWVR